MFSFSCSHRTISFEMKMHLNGRSRVACAKLDGTSLLSFPGLTCARITASLDRAFLPHRSLGATYTSSANCSSSSPSSLTQSLARTRTQNSLNHLHLCRHRRVAHVVLHFQVDVDACRVEAQRIPERPAVHRFPHRHRKPAPHSNPRLHSSTSTTSMVCHETTSQPQQS